MSRRILFGAAAIVLGAALWYAFRPERLVIDRTVAESFPVAAAPAASGVATPVANGDMSAAADVALLASGAFHGVAHETRGTATVHRLADGRRVLRFTDFATSNGPDVRVYLVAAPDATDDATVTRSGFVEIGPLKGNRGDQNYELPADLDLARYRAVTIWCKRFRVNFATAPLAAA